jgi:hypothetical protein
MATLGPLLAEFGASATCEALGLSRATFYRHKAEPAARAGPQADRRGGGARARRLA